ncbi:DUF4132 domain-containing protein [Longispora albida]|uniref:DUF4132 domain-containing protein n=1 Tax=Longispora albida TaxID=203523 RepID=UPI00036F72A2|nr:DUF4132 domain-containing protein [Longispora albida]
MNWLAAGGGYQVTLREGTVVARNAKGKELRSLPAALREDPVVTGLRQLTEWLVRHQAHCAAEVEKWMIRSLPVPMALVSEVWADDCWRAALADLVVTAGEETGFLRDAGPEGAGLVTVDGDTLRVKTTEIKILHPVLIEELDDFREFAADLGVSQSATQLFRETWVKPEGLDAQAGSVTEFSGGRYEQLRHLTGRATSLGYPVRGGYAVCRVVEGGQASEARCWIGADDPYYEAETGDLVFTGPSGGALTLGEVGPIAWSEGMRMAAALYAGRVPDKNQNETEEA